MAMRSVVSRGGRFGLTEINSRSSASSVRHFSGATGLVPSEVERAKETGFFKKMAKGRQWDQNKRKLKKLELPTHYFEVNYKTLKAVMFSVPDIRQMGIPHGLKGEAGSGKDGEIR